MSIAVVGRASGSTMSQISLGLLTALLCIFSCFGSAKSAKESTASKRRERERSEDGGEMREKGDGRAI